MQTAHNSEHIYPEITGLSVQEIASITSSDPSPEERFMLNSLNCIEGLMLEKEALALFRICKRLPNKAKILEIGSYQGGSTLAIGHAIANTDIELYCLDPWSNYFDQGDFAGFERSKISDDFRIINNFIKNTAFISDNLRMLRGKSSAFAEMLEGMEFDFIFIDGAHDYDSVRNDIKIAFSAIKPGGFLCGHDFHNHGDGVVRAVYELIVNVPSIITGLEVIEGTFIWFGIVPEPRYEYIMTDISDLMNAGLLKEALEKAEAACAEFKNAEIINYISAIKFEINRQL
ncbi:MAG TPA: class I SAM-dependent methyltransferase [Desulfuromonadaceae bacterium]